MNETKKEGRIGTIMTITVFLVVIFFGIYTVTQFDPSRFSESYQKCKQDIDNMKGISNDYRLGWNDCLKHFKMLWDSGTNMTQNLVTKGE